MKRKMNDSICISSPITQRRPSLEISRYTQNHSGSSSPSADIKEHVDQELPDTARLAYSKCFQMTESPNGKFVGCGEYVGLNPEDSRFVIRIYNRDFKLNGKLKDYVEMTIEEFSQIHSHKSEIEKIIKDVRVRQTIYESGDFKVTVGRGSSINPAVRNTVEIEKGRTKTSMYIETFTRMMSYLPEINEEYSSFKKRREEQIDIFNEIINVLAYVRNEKRSNMEIREPNIGRVKGSGIFTTCSKIVEQAKMILNKNE